MSVVDQIHLKKEKLHYNDVFTTAANHRILIIVPDSKEVNK